MLFVQIVDTIQPVAQRQKTERYNDTRFHHQHMCIQNIYEQLG